MDPVHCPPVENIPYKLVVHNLWENEIFENSDHVFFVQTATHGYDLTLMLDSMRAVGNERALVLALFDPNTTSYKHIWRWHSEGVRAIKKYVDLIKPFDWVLQLYTKMERIIELEDFLPALGVRFVFDHYGDPRIPISDPPFKYWDAWVKISGAYRLNHVDSDIWEDLDPVTLELFEQAPKRVVFGSDWPHTRFEGLDVRPWVSYLLDLTEGEQWLRERFFRENALELWGHLLIKPPLSVELPIPRYLRSFKVPEASTSPAMFSPRGITSILAKAPSDVVVFPSLRSLICRANRGSLKDAFPEELLASVLKATLDRVPNLDPSIIEDVVVGVVLSELGGSKAARMAMNHVGYPNTTSLYTFNRAWMISVGIGAGMESMTRNYGSRAIPTDIWPALREFSVQDALDCILPIGVTSKSVAERYDISREDQDTFAVNSHLKAAEARASGLFSDEVVRVTQKNPDEPGEFVVDTDDGIRPQASLEGLAKLKPVFKENGTSTAGNSSQVSDSAAATLLMKLSTAKELGLSGNIMVKLVLQPQ
ncbi:hypothetical protein LZL87_010723 [Fusarium oxysporum]|nr:hypothetical protein LZL87_010723 [Fusarium oxysporum]